jgi:2,3-bisphosphoglycerate-independent phosphoglycerate mutase
MQELVHGLVQKNSSKIIMFVLDGIGGLPVNGVTELEAASTPNLDALAKTSACGLHSPVGPGITPGSGPGHLALFGYDPVKNLIGRGVLEAMGLGLEVKKTDVAVRCNYSTIQDGLITDRRAGRPSSEETRVLTEHLQKEIPSIDGVSIVLGAGMEHRFALVMRFEGPVAPDDAALNDTDPQQEGKAPLALVPAARQAEATARVAQEFVARAARALTGRKRENYVLLRGFSTVPHMPSFDEAYGLKALALANYPMYRGLARIIGMETPVIGGAFDEEMKVLESRYKEFDFFFLHFKKTDSMGEDGNFEGKVKKIEEADSVLPRLLELNPDVLIVTGDHSTPAALRGHSWHPVPVMLRSPYVLGGLSSRFTERACAAGELGTFPATALMPLALANARRLKKFGA